MASFAMIGQFSKVSAGRVSSWLSHRLGLVCAQMRLARSALIINRRNIVGQTGIMKTNLSGVRRWLVTFC